MSKHRLDALADGIFAVAMTLLVIELKLPEDFHPERSLDLLQVLAQLIPRFVGWVISFFVLAMFWWGQARVMHYVQRVDGRLVGLNLLLLGAASLMPFASAITGQMPKLLGGQIVYSTAMLRACRHSCCGGTCGGTPSCATHHCRRACTRNLASVLARSWRSASRPLPLRTSFPPAGTLPSC